MQPISLTSSNFIGSSSLEEASKNEKEVQPKPPCISSKKANHRSHRRKSKSESITVMSSSLSEESQKEGIGQLETYFRIPLTKIAIFTRIYLGSNSCQTCKPKLNETIPSLMARMLKNQRKALEEHHESFDYFQKIGVKLGLQRNVYASVDEGLPSIEELEKYDASKSLKLTEDSIVYKDLTLPVQHFTIDEPNWMFTGIVDGYSSNSEKEHKISTKIIRLIRNHFLNALYLSDSNIHLVLTGILHKIHSNIVDEHEFRGTGATCLLTYLDKKNHRIYTATLGNDSEATIFRVFHDQLKAIPLSCVRNWASKKDFKRATVDYNIPIGATMWTTGNPDRSIVRESGEKENEVCIISRMIGMKHLPKTEEFSGIIHKPKITVNKLLPGDVVILSSNWIRSHISDLKTADLLTEHLKFCEERTVGSEVVSGCCSRSHVVCESPSEHISKHLTQQRYLNDYRIVSIKVN